LLLANQTILQIGFELAVLIFVNEDVGFASLNILIGAQFVQERRQNEPERKKHQEGCNYPKS